MAVADTLRGIITADASGVEKAVSDAEQEMDGLAGRAEKTGERMAAAGKRMTLGITAPLTAMGGMAVRQSGNFQEAMQQSIAVMGDVDEAMREDLEQTAREVAKTTSRSHEEAAESFYFLASAGLTAEESMAALPQVAAFAEAGQMNMAEATDVATNVMSAYGIEAENMSEVTDVMTETVRNHNQTMEGMSAAFRSAAPAAASMGVEIEELSALTGALGDVGIQGAEAGTALNSIMRRMAKRSGEAGQALDELGIQTTDANGELLPLVDIIEQLEDANMTAAQSSAIFGRQLSAGNALVNTGADELRNYQGRLEDADGATNDVAETQRDTFNKELGMTRDRLNDAAITIGADLLPMVSALAGHVGAAADAFAGLSDRQQKVILAVAGLVAVAGPTLWILGTLAQSAFAVSSAYTALSGASLGLSSVLSGGVVPAALAANVALGPLTIPIWALIAAIGALTAAGAGLYYAWTNNIFGVRDATTDAFNTVKGWFDAAPDWILALIGPIGWLYKAWSENLFGVQDTVGNVFDWIGSKIGWLIDKIKTIPGIGGDNITPEQEAVDESMPDPAASLPDMGAQGESDGVDYGQNFAGGVEDGLSQSSFEVAASEAIAEEFGGVEVGDQITVDEMRLEKMMDATEGGVTADDLGLTQEQFNALARSRRSSHSSLGASSTGTSATGQSPPSDLLRTATGGGSPSGSGLSASEIAKAIRDALAGMAISLQGDLDVENLEEPVLDIVDAELVAAGDELTRLRSRSP